MNCQIFTKNIPAFLDKQLDYDELNDFLEHVNECPECKEELSIELLIREGLNSLEKGNSFDLNKELLNHLQHSEYVLRHRESLIWLLYSIIGFDIVAFVIMMILLVFS